MKISNNELVKNKRNSLLIHCYIYNSDNNELDITCKQILFILHLLYVKISHKRSHL